MITDDDISAYLDRLDLEREPPSVDALFRLHRAQLEHVPYETTWIHMGHHYGTDREESLRRTLERRPDLLENADLTDEDRKTLDRIRRSIPRPA